MPMADHTVHRQDGESEHERLLRELAEQRRIAGEGGGATRIEAQHKRGKKTARERLQLLFDDGAWHEIDMFWSARPFPMALEDDDNTSGRKVAPGDGVVTGYGKIQGRPVAAYAQDFTIQGGSFSEVQGQKLSRLFDLATESGIPVVGLMDSVGARIQEGVYSLSAFSHLFWHNSQASGVIPQISVMLGPCAGGSVYAPGLTDFVIMTEGTSQMFITGPSVIQAVTGEEVDKESLGGASVHAALSGVAHFSAKTEEEAILLVRSLLSFLPSNNQEPPPRVSPTDDPARRAAALDSLVPVEADEPYDMLDVITHVFDNDSFLQVHRHFAANAIVGFARLHGATLGVIANQPLTLAGVLDIDASDKIARFIRFCDAFNIPLITFVDTPGFLPGVAQEHGGIIRHGAKIVYAYSEATVPKIAVITRKAYGGAYIVMSSKYIRTDLVFAWPTAEIAVMGAEGAVDVLHGRALANSDDPETQRQGLIENFRRTFSTPYVAARSGHVDDIIIPSETRRHLVAALELLRDKVAKAPLRKHSNMPM